MALEWKVNWSQSQERFTAWWEHSVVDRPLLLVWAPRKEPLPPPEKLEPPVDLQQQWLDVDYRLAAFRHQVSKTYYEGDSYPCFEPYLGPGSLQLFLGSTPNFHHNTVWYMPIYSDIKQAPEPIYNVANPYWQLTCEMAGRAMQECQGKALVACCDLIENLDVLASLRGTEELLMDLIDHPEDVHRLQRAILTAYFEYYDRLSNIIRDVDGGTCFMAFNIWGPGRVAKVQCDISAMLSPDMFAEFVVPYLREQCQRLDYTLYHLDGPEAVCHLDHLLSINELDAIQWTPGAGKAGCGDRMWYPLYERVLKAGKSLHLDIARPDLIEALLREFGPNGILVHTRASNKADAESIIERSRGWM